MQDTKTIITQGLQVQGHRQMHIAVGSLNEPHTRFNIPAMHEAPCNESRIIRSNLSKAVVVEVIGKLEGVEVNGTCVEALRIFLTEPDCLAFCVISTASEVRDSVAISA